MKTCVKPFSLDKSLSFNDFAKAFDSVSHDLIFMKLTKMFNSQ